MKWWSAIASEADAVVGTNDLTALHAWWASARRTDLEADKPSLDVSPAARALLAALLAAGRPWPIADLSLLSDHASGLGELRQAGRVDVERGWVVLGSESSDADVEGVSPADSERVASALAARFEGDAWARARAAELLLRASAFDQADAEHALALSLVNDAAVRQEIVERWMADVQDVPAEAQLELRMRSAERALGIGEADEAHRWAQTAAVLAPTDASVTLLLGRAAVAMGDLVAAKVALERGRAGSPSPEMAALIAVELAEVACLNGEWPEATVEANRALELTGSDISQCSTTLRARNTLGKLLLAKSSWAEADRHFAEDALFAMAHGERTAELRARLNRGIAQMSSGSLDEARAIFQSVYEEGERIGTPGRARSPSTTSPSSPPGGTSTRARSCFPSAP